MSLNAKPCLKCFERAQTNSSGRSNCNRRNPCKWCSNKKLECIYDYDTPSGEDIVDDPIREAITQPTATKHAIPPPPSTASGLALPEDMKVFYSNHDDGNIMVRFDPDPLNLGLVDPYKLGEGDLDPDELPVNNYSILVDARKRKRARQLTFFEDARPYAKRLRGGADQDFAGGEGEGSNPPQTPPRHAEQQVLDPMARVLQSVVESSKTNNELFMQFMAKHLNEERQGKLLPSTNSSIVFLPPPYLHKFQSPTGPHLPSIAHGQLSIAYGQLSITHG